MMPRIVITFLPQPTTDNGRAGILGIETRELCSGIIIHPATSSDYRLEPFLPLSCQIVILAVPPDFIQNTDRKIIGATARN